MTRILCCGDRNWTDWETIRRVLRALPPGTVIIEGENGEVDIYGKVKRGADKMCAQVAKELGFKVLPFVARWHTYGKGAGPIRNKQMIDVGKPTFVFAFHSDLSKSRGTADMVRQALKVGLGVEVFKGLICPKCNGVKVSSHTSKVSNFGMEEFVVPEGATLTITGSCVVCSGRGVV